MLCPDCSHEIEYHGESGCSACTCPTKGSTIAEAVYEPKPSESESLSEVFKQACEEGKIDMFEEALDNIHQLKAIISELRQSLIEANQENAALRDRIETLNEIIAGLRKDRIYFVQKQAEM